MCRGVNVTGDKLRVVVAPVAETVLTDLAAVCPAGAGNPAPTQREAMVSLGRDVAQGEIV